MSNTPEELFYTTDHEWVKKLDGHALIGITDFAQNALGDIVFIELPETEKVVSKGESFGVVESIKSVSDLYCPLSGEIVEVNEELQDRPELCNEDPYNNWIIKLKLNSESEFDELLNAQKYQAHCDSQ